MRTPTKFYMGSPLRKRDMSNMCSKMPHVHVYCSGEARRLTGGLGLHILSMWGASVRACVRAHTRVKLWQDGVPSFLWLNKWRCS